MLLREEEASCSSVSFSSACGLAGQCVPMPLPFWPQCWLVQPISCSGCESLQCGLIQRHSQTLQPDESQHGPWVGNCKYLGTGVL